MPCSVAVRIKQGLGCLVLAMKKILNLALLKVKAEI
jgi:hypothetical protein